MSQCTISCELHDYLEIACLYGYQVRLVLKNQQVVAGKALDLLTTEKREYLVVENGQQQQNIELNELSKMLVITAHARFKEVTF